MKIFQRFFKKSEDPNPWMVEASPGIARSYYTYFCAFIELEKESIRPRFNIWSGIDSSVCWLEAGNSGLYVPHESAGSPEELAKQLYLHEQEITETGYNVIFKNQVPPTLSDLNLCRSGSFMRISIPPGLVFKVCLEMDRLYRDRLDRIRQNKNI